MATMQRLSGVKRKSDQLEVSDDDQNAIEAGQKTTTKNDSTHPDESPAKRQRVGVTLAQKQALIDNLQLELTERARKLRANYNIHAQSLRTRIEIRVNRIPLALRKLTMGELLEKYSDSKEPQPQQKSTANAGSVRGPPVPAKDGPSRPPTRAGNPSQPVKRRSHEMTGGDKENEVRTPQQKKQRGNQGSSRNRQQVLSPTNSNTRLTRGGNTTSNPPTSTPGRPNVTPSRATAATNALNRMVEGAGGSVRRPTTATGTYSTTAAGTFPRNKAGLPPSIAAPGTPGAATAAAAAARRKRAATSTAASTATATTTASQHPPRPATRTARRASGTSESSEASTSTVIHRKRPMTAPPGAHPKPPAASLVQQTGAGGKKGTGTAGGTLKRGGVAGTGNGGTLGRKAGAAVKGAMAAAGGAAGGTGTGRVLRKRG
ncbi:Borealin N terminal-domain-containing protein [Chaetomium sp. MPI-SDFR-AT-0129]|nr:Borealin N terminal-domain-containing protein [Chaetomium sp. MPI-SDFR-AT-0129]